VASIFKVIRYASEEKRWIEVNENIKRWTLVANEAWEGQLVIRPDQLPAQGRRVSRR
jgi:hypothetical protein